MNVYSVTSRRTELLAPSRRIALSNIPARHREAATNAPQLMIGESGARNGPSPSNLYAFWAGALYKRENHTRYA